MNFRILIVGGTVSLAAVWFSANSKAPEPQPVFSGQSINNACDPQAGQSQKKLRFDQNGHIIFN